MSYTLIGFIIYLVIILVVGFISYKKNKSHSDFFIAGRKLNPWVVAFSERASGESAWLLLGLPGAALATGFLETWTALGCVLGISFYWFVIAKRLRIESEKLSAITLPNFFAEKFGKNVKSIRVVATFIIIFFFTFYLAAQFNGAGKVLNVTFNIPIVWGMVIGALVIIFYTMMGGFFAVAWTDLIQGILMISALVVIPIAGMLELHQEGGSLATAVAKEGDDFASLFGGKTGWPAAVAVIGGLSWALGYMGQPHLLTRFMAIENPGKIKISRRIAIAWAIPAFAGAIIIGLVGLGLYEQDYFDDVENVMPYLANNILPAWLAGIFISGAIAAMMSTADSQLLVITSSVIEDFYHKTLGKNVTEKVLLNLSRIITIIVGVLGFVIAITSKELIFELVSYAWAGLGSSFGPALLLMLYWKKTTKQGVLAGMLTGFFTTIIWQNIDILNNFLTVRLVSFVFALLAIIIVSFFTKSKK
ncbi:MAG: sodium/proline symporter [Bacteroidota bacterium]|nr:sodium/proline symporter [Bacteroidota bacterium]